ncbi:MAG: mandelate racemase [Burkholderiales bacterium]|nr:mandelate racemase [Burkholderiales bacterium]
MQQSVAALPRLTLESVHVRAALVPLRRPIVSKVGIYPEWPFLLVDVKTREGVVGSAYLEPYVKGAMGAIAQLIQGLADQWKGKPLAPLDVFRKGMQSLHLVGRQGMSMIALSGLDMALWDALAKAAGVPLAVLLGGSVGSVRAYNTNGLWLIPQERIADEAAELVAEGFDAIKLRLGRPTLREDIRVIDTVRKTVGDDIRLMSDFNQGLALDEALLRCHALDDQGLQWFEEPIVYDDYAGCAQLARELKTPLQIGENIYGPREFLKAVQAQASDLYMPDLMRIGGVTGWLRAAAIAGAAGLPLSSHLYPEVSGHLLRVSDSADWLESRDWGNPLVQEPFVIDNGTVIVPDRPGNGIAWNEDAVKRYAV